MVHMDHLLHSTNLDFSYRVGEHSYDLRHIFRSSKYQYNAILLLNIDACIQTDTSKDHLSLPSLVDNPYGGAFEQQYQSMVFPTDF